jgi:hypothetical protein
MLRFLNDFNSTVGNRRGEYGLAFCKSKRAILISPNQCDAIIERGVAAARPMTPLRTHSFQENIDPHVWL